MFEVGIETKLVVHSVSCVADIMTGHSELLLHRTIRVHALFPLTTPMLRFIYAVRAC